MPSKRVHASDKVPWITFLLCYAQLATFIFIGHVRDYLGRVFGSRYAPETTQRGYARLLIAWENFYTNRIYHRLQDAFNRPVAGCPEAHIDVIERVSVDGNRTFRRQEGSVRHCINLGSYNYLGFADDWMNTCSKDVFSAVEQYGLAATAPRMEFGTSVVHQRLERAVAAFVGKPAAIVYNMGYATNATSIPALMGMGTLLVSDSMNHSSIVNGARASGATIAVFRHNDATHLATVLHQDRRGPAPHTPCLEENHGPGRRYLLDGR